MNKDIIMERCRTKLQIMHMVAVAEGKGKDVVNITNEICNKLEKTKPEQLDIFTGWCNIQFALCPNCRENLLDQFPKFNELEKIKYCYKCGQRIYID